MSIPAHHSTEATPGDRGRGLGAAQADRIAAIADVYLRLFRLKGLDQGDVLGFGAEALDRIGVFSPELYDEIAGIAAGSGLAPELIGALNARTELLAAGRGECSTIACLGTATSSRRHRSASRPGTGTTSSRTAGCAGRSTIPTAIASRR